jgi:hypothetical protein
VRLHEMRDPHLGFLNMPEWDPLRSDSRFQAIRLHTGMSDEIDAQLAAARAAARAAAK